MFLLMRPRREEVKMAASRVTTAPMFLVTGTIKPGFQAIRKGCSTVRLLLGFLLGEYIHGES